MRRSYRRTAGLVFGVALALSAGACSSTTRLEAFYAPSGKPVPRAKIKGRPEVTAVSWMDQLAFALSPTREIVPNSAGEKPGTVVISTREKHLDLVLEDGRVLRYAIGVGREGFQWSGVSTVGRKAEWPDWRPPAQMLERRPELPRHMEGGIDNPLGARALYLYAGGRDTMFRIHGTNEPASIGKNVSSGCIRLLNADVEDLYKRVPVGAKVIVR